MIERNLFTRGASLMYSLDEYHDPDRRTSAYRKNEANICFECTKPKCTNCLARKRLNPSEAVSV